MVALNTINQLVANSTANIDLLDGLDWVIVPVLNPDGYIYTFEAVSYEITDFVKIVNLFCF